MLRLVRPVPPAQGNDPPARRKRARSLALSLSAEEMRHLRTAIRNASRAYGGADVLALVVGVPAHTLYNAMNSRRHPSGTLAIRIAKAAGISVEAVLTGALNAAGRCPACGHRAGEGRLVVGSGS